MEMWPKDRTNNKSTLLTWPVLAFKCEVVSFVKDYVVDFHPTSLRKWSNVHPTLIVFHVFFSQPPTRKLVIPSWKLTCPFPFQPALLSRWFSFYIWIGIATVCGCRKNDFTRTHQMVGLKPGEATPTWHNSSSSKQVNYIMWIHNVILYTLYSYRIQRYPWRSKGLPEIVSKFSPQTVVLNRKSQQKRLNNECNSVAEMVCTWEDKIPEFLLRQEWVHFALTSQAGQGNCLRNSGIFWKFIENKLLLHQHESPKTSYSFLNKRYNVCRVHGNPLQQNIQHNMYHLSPKRQNALVKVIQLSNPSSWCQKA